MKLLVTGGAGFIGSNFIHHVLDAHSDWQVTNLDKLTYAGNLENLKDIKKDNRYRFIKGDIADSELVDRLLLGQSFDVVVNFAAESHVDRSILDALPFIKTNVQGAQILLESARQHRVGLFLQVSTDEVYGSLGARGKFTEESPLLPNSPYAASKAAADLLCRAYYQTHGLPVIITHCSNNYGPYQFPEKLIPLAIGNALEDKPIPIYGKGLNVRDWIHVTDHCRAIALIIQRGQPGETYNIGADNEITNFELMHKLLEVMGKPKSLITFVSDRPGHDQRYAVDASKIGRELDWKPAISFEEGLGKTIQWYIENKSWGRRIKSGEYAKYYERMYSQR
jgi:dTDP-glucose 4,6-dehydratase